MQVRRKLIAMALLAFGSVAAKAQTPVLGSIEAPYANMQGTVRLAGQTWGAGAVAYGPVGTPLILGGFDLGTTGTVTFIPYAEQCVGQVHQNSEQCSSGAVPASSPSQWASNMISVTVPQGAVTGMVVVTVEDKTSNALPFIVTPGSYAGICPVGPSANQLQITTTSLHDGTVGLGYSATLNASEGTPPYTWSIVSGTLPAGLSLNASTGTISGNPTTAVESDSVTFEVTDSSLPPQSDQAVLDISIESQQVNSGAMVYSYAASYDGDGNVQQYQDTVMGTWNFSYDAFNRLQSGTALSSGTGSLDFTGENLCWAYDSYGNRTTQSMQTASCPAQGASTWVFGANNQVSGIIPPGGTQASPSPLTYDAAGNVLIDDTSFNEYLYDAEGRICAVQSSTGLGSPIITGYIYDADGVRVAKGTIYVSGLYSTVNGVLQPTIGCDPTTWVLPGLQITENYVLGPAGEELSMLDGQNNWQRTNVYAGGKLIGTYDTNGLHFHIEDPLGTRRMQLNGNMELNGNPYAVGQPETDIQSLPFGDGLFPFPDQYAPSFADDATTLHFTGKERDTESGNDYFSARYYASAMGRFMSPDPLPWLGWQHPPEGSSEEEEEESHKKFEEFIANPQNFNMYAYVNNNPLNHTDPTGMAGCKAGDKTFTTCTITVTYDPKTSKGTLTVTGMNKGDKEATTLLTASVVVGGDGHVTPTGTFTAKSWEKDHVSTLYGNAANTPWSKTALGGNAFGPYQLHIKELDGRGIMIHGTMGPGWSPTTWGNAIFLSPTSHGCIRMCNADDINLHNMMPNPSGNKIIIQTTP